MIISITYQVPAGLDLWAHFVRFNTLNCVVFAIFDNIGPLRKI